VEEDQMNVSGSRAADDINLEEFERRLRAAGAQQANVEDPLQELARLVESSYVGSSSETSARLVSEPDKRSAESARSIETAALRPAIDETEDLIPAASEADRAARQDYEFDATRSNDPQDVGQAADRRPGRWKLTVSALALAGFLLLTVWKLPPWIVVVLLAVLLSFDSVGEMFRQRASFDQSYDEGRFGRFGRHILGAQMALDLPFGIGPLQFHNYFPEDTHNSYLNAFMSGGWIAGICYPVLVFVTVIMGFRHVFIRVPWQRAYLAIFSAFLGTVGESFIIDTDHWRHFWMMLGAMWGMFAAAQRYKSTTDQPVMVPGRAC